MSTRSTGREREPADKPYDFVSFPDKPVRREKPPGHHVFNPELFHGELFFQLRTLGPLFVSSGQAALSEDLGFRRGDVVFAHYRINSRLAIPASSLKGTVRSVVEAVSASCLIGVPKFEARSLPEFLRYSCTRSDFICPACILFGKGGSEAYLGQVSFEDALLEEGRTVLYRLPVLHRPRIEAPLYRDRNRLYKGRKFYKHGNPRPAERGGESEVVSPGSVFSGGLSFKNLTEEQVGLLFYGLGLEGRFWLKLGGGKPACLGSLVIEPLRLVFYKGREVFLGGGDGDLEIKFEGEALKVQIQKFITIARQKEYILVRQAEELEGILRYDPGILAECPIGIY